MTRGSKQRLHRCLLQSAIADISERVKLLTIGEASLHRLTASAIKILPVGTAFIVHDDVVGVFPQMAGEQFRFLGRGETIGFTRTSLADATVRTVFLYSVLADIAICQKLLFGTYEVIVHRHIEEPFLRIALGAFQGSFALIAEDGVDIVGHQEMTDRIGYIPCIKREYFRPKAEALVDGMNSLDKGLRVVNVSGGDV